jgi:hypothetical protein
MNLFHLGFIYSPCRSPPVWDIGAEFDLTGVPCWQDAGCMEHLQRILRNALK